MDNDVDPIIERRRAKRRRQRTAYIIGGLAVAGALLVGCVGLGLYAMTYRDAGGKVRFDPTAPVATTRDLDKAALRELADAFKDNPVTAQKKYEGTRWRFSGRVWRIESRGDVSVKSGADALDEYLELTMRGGEVEKLKTGETFRMEGRFAKYTPFNHFEGRPAEVHFEDVVVAGR